MDPNEPRLTGKQSLFVEEYLVDRNATQAAIRAGYSAKTAGNIGDENLKKPHIAAIIIERSKARIKRLELSQDDILLDVYNVVKADPRDLIEYRRGCCRHCYGLDFGYQRTPAEYARDLEMYLESKQGKLDPTGAAFPYRGGTGFDRRKDPAPDCPECFGEGEGYEFIKDTRKLSPEAATLYAGVKSGRNGIEVLTRNKDKARDLMAAHMGMLKTKVEFTGKNGGPLRMVAGEMPTVMPTDPIEAAKLYADFMKGQ